MLPPALCDPYCFLFRSHEQFDAYINLFKRSLVKAGVEPALKLRLQGMLERLRGHIVARDDSLLGTEDESALLISSLNALQIDPSVCPYSSQHAGGSLPSTPPQ